MEERNLSILEIHSLSNEQFNREKENGDLNENALYLVPDEEIVEEINENSLNSQIPTAKAVYDLVQEVLSKVMQKPETGTDVGPFEFTELSEHKVEGSSSGSIQEYLTLVSDTVLTEEQMKNAIITYVPEDFIDGVEEERTTIVGTEECDLMSIELDNGTLLAITNEGGEHALIVSVPNDNISIPGGWSFDKAGTYFSVWVDTENNNEFVFGVKKMMLIAKVD